MKRVILQFCQVLFFFVTNDFCPYHLTSFFLCSHLFFRISESSHPALRFWRPTEESKEKENLDDKVGDKLDDVMDKSMEFSIEEEDKDKSDVKEGDDRTNRPKVDLVDEASTILSNTVSVSGKNRDSSDREEELPLGQNPNTRSLSGELSSVNNGSESSLPANGMKDTETPIVNETSMDSCTLGENTNVKSNCIESKSDTDRDDGAQNESLDIVNAKLKLQDHLDDIENKLNQRMDEIESNIDGKIREYF